MLFLLALLLPAVANHTYYLRHRPVNGIVQGRELWVYTSDLRRYLNEAEMKRIKLEATQALVDGRPAAPVETDLVAFLKLTQALGYVQKPSPGLGFIDLVAPNAEPQAVSSLRRADYRVASERLEMVLGVLPEYRDPVMMRRVETIGLRVARASPLSDLNWKFVVVDSEVPNAACTGEGNIFVTRGLLDLQLTDDELAGVLGHEIAHGVRRHCFRLVELFKEYLLIMRDVDRYRAKVAAYQRGESTLVSEGTLENERRAIEQRHKALVSRMDNERVYGRQDEEEADVLGLRYAVQAGYGRGGLGSALQKLQKYKYENFGEAVLEDDMTHPPIPRRLEILRRVQAGWQ